MEEIIAEPTNANDLFKIAKKRCNVYEYGDLKDYDHIDDIFEEHIYDDDDYYDDDYSQSDDCEREYVKEEEYPFDNNSAIILYKSEPMFGHWTMLTRNGSGYNYLDSYGGVIDNPLKYVPKSINKELGQDKKYLAKLLLKATEGGSDVYYNNARLQKLDPNIATCGRYCAMYLKYSNMNVDDFAKMIKKISKNLKMPNDEVITYLSMVDSNSE